MADGYRARSNAGGRGRGGRTMMLDDIIEIMCLFICFDIMTLGIYISSYIIYVILLLTLSLFVYVLVVTYISGIVSGKYLNPMSDL
jgi:hypothetical protein